MAATTLLAHSAAPENENPSAIAGVRGSPRWLPGRASARPGKEQGRPHDLQPNGTPWARLRGLPLGGWHMRRHPTLVTPLTGLLGLRPQGPTVRLSRRRGAVLVAVGAMLETCG